MDVACCSQYCLLLHWHATTSTAMEPKVGAAPRTRKLYIVQLSRLRQCMADIGADGPDRDRQWALRGRPICIQPIGQTRYAYSQYIGTYSTGCYLSLYIGCMHITWSARCQLYEYLHGGPLGYISARPDSIGTDKDTMKVSVQHGRRLLLVQRKHLRLHWCRLLLVHV